MNNIKTIFAGAAFIGSFTSIASFKSIFTSVIPKSIFANFTLKNISSGPSFRRIFTRVTCKNIYLGVTLLTLCIIIAGCGRTGDPRPRQATRSFAWQELNAVPSGECLDISAVMSGLYSNLEAVILEFASVGEADCPSCPFLVKEQIPVQDLSKVFNSAKGELRFSYCPRVKAPAYRLRLVGINVYDTSRHAVSPVKYIEMPAQKR